MSIGWSEALALNHPVIDGQHREIFRRYEALARAAESGDHREEGRLFEFLGGYVVEHFAAEEQLMAQAGYPERAAHRAAHDQFVHDFLDYGQALAWREPTRPSRERIVTWMAEWLTGHIAGTDRRLASYLAGREAG
jgi:hemerythrin